VEIKKNVLPKCRTLGRGSAVGITWPYLLNFTGHKFEDDFVEDIDSH
jgi:hypothetical protein